MTTVDHVPALAVDDALPGLLAEARSASAGRSGRKLVGGPHSHMTQTMIALRSGERLKEHENPGEATVLVLHGRVRLEAASDGVTVQGQKHALLQVPPSRHALVALEDSVVLLTAVKTRGANVQTPAQLMPTGGGSLGSGRLSSAGRR